MINSRHIWISRLGRLSFLMLVASSVGAQTPKPALLVLEKDDNTLAIVDPASLKIAGRVPAGPDPHEVESSTDGKLAYISNYGGSDSALRTISVVDLIAQKALPPIVVSATLDRVFTSNVSSGTISIIEQVPASMGGVGPPPGGRRKTWR